jgi:hypothetical protein
MPGDLFKKSPKFGKIIFGIAKKTQRPKTKSFLTCFFPQYILAKKSVINVKIFKSGQPNEKTQLEMLPPSRKKCKLYVLLSSSKASLPISAR